MTTKKPTYYNKAALRFLVPYSVADPDPACHFDADADPDQLASE
jgi:hypothetical protein